MNKQLHTIKSLLGEPYFETKDFLLYNMDCVDGMKKMNEEIFDLTVTSPPYNIGKEYEETISLEEYLSWCKVWLDIIYKITKPKGALLLNLGYLEIPGKGHAIPIPYLLWSKTKFYLIQEIVWNYGAGVACKTKLSPRNEKILWYVKNANDYTFNLDAIRDKNVKYPNQKKKGKLRANSLGKNPSDVWQIAKVTSGANRASKERAPHPAQFPMDMIEKIIKGFSNENDLVLDPFIGSGTVAEVAIRNNRKVVGFEIVEEYCDYIVKRINNVYNEINQEKLNSFVLG